MDDTRQGVPSVVQEALEASSDSANELLTLIEDVSNDIYVDMIRHDIHELSDIKFDQRLHNILLAIRIAASRLRKEVYVK